MPRGIYKHKKWGMTDLERFWSHVEIDFNTGCWVWTASTIHSGYGSFKVNGRTETAHRYAYKHFHNAEIPQDKEVMHSCDNRRCCAPHHLSLGTRKDNAHDASVKGRTAKPFGNKRGAKLTEDQVREIRSIYLPYKVTVRQLAEKYGVSEGTINQVIYYSHWKQVS